MKLSIIIPVYNGEKYINDCLKTILDNNSNDFEVIVVNDGSKDKTKEIIEEINDKRIKLYNNENHGVSYSRNFGLKKASGEYIMFVDADDLLCNNWNEIVIDNIKGDFSIFSKENLSSKKIVLIKQICGVNNDGIIIAGPVSKVYKRELINNYKIEFNEDIINGEDMLFNLNFVKVAKNINIIKQSFYKYRINFGSATKSFNEKILQSDILFHQELKKINNDNNIKNILGCNGLFTIVDRISYVKKYSEAKKWFDKIDLKFYSNYSSENLGKFEKRIIKRALKNKNYLNYVILRAKHFIISKIRKEYFKEI